MSGRRSGDSVNGTLPMLPALSGKCGNNEGHANRCIVIGPPNFLNPYLLGFSRGLGLGFSRGVGSRILLPRDAAA